MFVSSFFDSFSVLIGAPRAQSTLEIQRRINETGAIYKCTFDQANDGSCAPFVFDQWGNVHDKMDQFTYNNEKKDYQWLGAAMDGNSNDNDKLVVSIVFVHHEKELENKSQQNPLTKGRL